MNRVEFLTQPMTHPIGLHIFCLQLFGPKYIGWEAETIWQELKRTCGDEPSTLNKGKLQACRTIHVSDEPYEDWFIFEKIIQGLNFASPMFDTMQKPSVSALAQGVWAMMEVRTQPVGSDVEKYIAAVILDDGMVYPPKPLEFVAHRMRPLVPTELFEPLSRIGSSGAKSLPSDPTLAYQVLKRRGVDDYVSFCKRLRDEHVATAKKLAGKVSGSI